MDAVLSTQPRATIEIFVCCLRRQGICALSYENFLSIQKEMNNFLTSSVRIQVQNNQKIKSRASPPCDGKKTLTSKLL